MRKFYQHVSFPDRHIIFSLEYMLLWLVGSLFSLLKHVLILVKEHRGYVSFTIVIWRCRVRWHADTPYGYPHLLLARGKRACWHEETNVVICTFPGDVSVFRPRPRKNLNSIIVTRGSDSMWRYLMVICTFLIQRRQVRWRTETTYGRLHPSYPKTIKVPFIIQRRTSLMISGWRWLSISNHFEDFCRFYLCHLETFKSDDTQDSSMLTRDNQVR